MKLHDQSRDGSNLIGTISYLPKVDLSFVIRHLTYLTFSVNLHNQPFESSFSIDPHWIGDATGLCYVASSDVHT